MSKPKRSKKSFADCVWPAASFVQRDIPPRPWMVEGCIPAPSIGLLYAWRGAGKTLTAMDFALRVSRGEPWLDYKVPRPYATLYVDGEMPLPDLRSRLIAQSGPLGPPRNLFVLASEDLAVDHRNINLARPEDRAEFVQMILALDKEYETKIELIVLDNWTTLIRGLDGNDSAALDDLKDWCKLLRHGERSLLFVHHTGKSGAQRGTSAREDIIDYSIKLLGENGPEHFEWDKMRTGRVDPDEFDMHMVKDASGKYITLERCEPKRAGRQPKHDDAVLTYLVEHGASRHGEIAEALSLDRKSVSRALNRLCAAERVSWLADGQYCSS